MPPQVLQLCPLLPELEQSLAERFAVHRWFEADAPDALLDAHATEIRAVITGGHVGLPDELPARLPALEIVAINGVGFDKVDLEAARARGFRVTNTPDVLTDDVADLAIGLVIALLRRIPAADRHVRAGRWPEAEVPLGLKVSAQRFGILGLGRIGKAIARRLDGFGVSIAYTDLAAQDVPYAFHPTPTALADVVDVLIVAAAAGTRPLIDRTVLYALGPTGILVNVARGSLVDEAVLVAALQEGRLGGAALDVFAAEPRVPEVLWEMPNVVLTPHIASATIDTRRAMAELVLTNLDAHFGGRPLLTAVV
jgi:lactate dehydrogenase-like 2-hydroxyacid dehydrogenase